MVIEPLYTVAEAAALMRLGKTKVYRLISSGRLYAFTVDGPRTTRVPESAINALLADRQEAGTTRPTLRLVHDAEAA